MTSSGSTHPGEATTCCACSPPCSHPDRRGGSFYGGLVTGREPSPELLEPLSWTFWEGMQERSAVDYYLARTAARRLVAADRRVWDDYDVVLLPRSRAGRCASASSTRSDEPWEDFRRSGEFTPYTALFNTSGQPAISLPLYHGEDGLPVGIQLAGRPAKTRRRCFRSQPSSEATAPGLTGGRHSPPPSGRRRRSAGRSAGPPSGRSQSGTVPRRTCSRGRSGSAAGCRRGGTARSRRPIDRPRCPQCRSRSCSTPRPLPRSSTPRGRTSDPTSSASCG